MGRVTALPRFGNVLPHTTQVTTMRHRCVGTCGGTHTLEGHTAHRGAEGCDGGKGPKWCEGCGASGPESGRCVSPGGSIGPPNQRGKQFSEKFAHQLRLPSAKIRPGGRVGVKWFRVFHPFWNSPQNSECSECRHMGVKENFPLRGRKKNFQRLQHQQSPPKSQIAERQVRELLGVWRGGGEGGGCLDSNRQPPLGPRPPKPNPPPKTKKTFFGGKMKF